jgi:ubiquinone/menaquinone biosynthesis C-methylase UbiE
MRFVPAGGAAALDIGSGKGGFSRLLGESFKSVEGIDFSPQMIESAKSRTSPGANVIYRCLDFSNAVYQRDSFDCVTSIAALHHLPLRPTFEKVKKILKPKGVFLVLDLYKEETIADYLASVIGSVANRMQNSLRRIHISDAAKRAWTAHGRLDEYPTIREVRETCDKVLPGARLRRHIYFRYSLVWVKG